MNFYSFGSLFSPISIASSNTNDDLFIDNGPRLSAARAGTVRLGQSTWSDIF